MPLLDLSNISEAWPARPKMRVCCLAWDEDREQLTASFDLPVLRALVKTYVAELIDNSGWWSGLMGLPKYNGTP